MDFNNRRTGKDATKPRALGLLGHSVVAIFHLRTPMSFYYTSYTIRSVLLLIWMFISEENTTFQKASRNGILKRQGSLEIALKKLYGR